MVSDPSTRITVDVEPSLVDELHPVTANVPATMTPHNDFDFTLNPLNKGPEAAPAAMLFYISRSSRPADFTARISEEAHYRRLKMMWRPSVSVAAAEFIKKPFLDWQIQPTWWLQHKNKDSVKIWSF
jgi:hypothetical protein